MSTQRLLLKTSVADLQPVTLAGQPVTAQFERISTFLYARLPDRSVKPFAEPVESGTIVTWYGETTNEPVALTSLTLAQRPVAELQLKRVLATLDPLLDDSEVGALLRRALVVPSLDSVLIADDAVVLTNWGYAPASIGTDMRALARHLATMLGPYSPRLAAADERYFGPVSQGASAAAGDEGLTAAVRSPQPPPPRPVSDAVAPVAPAARPATSKVHLYWLAPLVAAVAATFLVLGFWLAWKHFASDLAGRQYNAPLVDEAKVRTAIQLQRETNAALERDLERARRALEAPNVCTPEAPGGMSPLPERQPIRPNSVPAPVPQRQGQAPAPFSGSLADLLEHATVWIVAPTPAGISTGSGFFISGDTVLTNAHVVEKADPNAVYVTSKAMGRVVQGKVIASTSMDSGEAKVGGADFAVVRLPEAVAGAQPLALSEHAEKLADVVAAGYPAAVIRVEEAAQELRQGKLSGAPELVLTRGSISSVQRLPSGIVIVPHSADISGGNSGGPLVDACGNVLGINSFVTAAERFADRTKYALKTDSLLPWLKQHGIAVQTAGQQCRPIAGPATPASPGVAPPGAAAPGATTPPQSGK